MYAVIHWRYLDAVIDENTQCQLIVNSPALRKAGGGVYRALAICTVLISITGVTAGLDSSICAAVVDRKTMGGNDNDYKIVHV